MITASKKLEILNKTSFDYKDVMDLLGCCRTKAFQVMNICKSSFNGQVGIFTTNIKPTSLFQALGLSLEEEINKTKLLLMEKNYNDDEKKLH